MASASVNVRLNLSDDRKFVTEFLELDLETTKMLTAKEQEKLVILGTKELRVSLLMARYLKTAPAEATGDIITELKEKARLRLTSVRGAIQTTDLQIMALQKSQSGLQNQEIELMKILQSLPCPNTGSKNKPSDRNLGPIHSKPTQVQPDVKKSKLNSSEDNAKEFVKANVVGIQHACEDENTFNTPVKAKGLKAKNTPKSAHLAKRYLRSPLQRPFGTGTGQMAAGDKIATNEQIAANILEKSGRNFLAHKLKKRSFSFEIGGRFGALSKTRDGYARFACDQLLTGPKTSSELKVEWGKRFGVHFQSCVNVIISLTKSRFGSRPIIVNVGSKREAMYKLSDDMIE